MNDIYNLERFINAQENSYKIALKEIQNGEKRSHWMWFIFPQIDGLGMSSMSREYSIKNQQEAKKYLDHNILGNRLIAYSAIPVIVKLGLTPKFEGFTEPSITYNPG